MYKLSKLKTLPNVIPGGQQIINPQQQQWESSLLMHSEFLFSWETQSDLFNSTHPSGVKIIPLYLGRHCTKAIDMLVGYLPDNEDTICSQRQIIAHLWITNKAPQAMEKKKCLGCFKIWQEQQRHCQSTHTKVVFYQTSHTCIDRHINNFEWTAWTYLLCLNTAYPLK